ncbi:hypothetical protein DTO280E4_3253 [Paecilomyces variotii]|nr:hypothetical protein DTO280E4_3253 [Paecilomyces variotii]
MFFVEDPTRPTRSSPFWSTDIKPSFFFVRALISEQPRLSLHPASYPHNLAASSISKRSFGIGPSPISPTMSVPGGKSCSNKGSPAALIFPRMHCRKCHLSSLSDTRLGSAGFRHTGSRTLPSIPRVSGPNNVILYPSCEYQIRK